MQRLTTIFTTSQVEAVELLIELLGEQGIEVELVHGADRAGASEGFSGWMPEVQLRVAAADAQRARRLALSFGMQVNEEHLAAVNNQLAALTAGTQAMTAAETDPWPGCPECGRPRTAVCPICQTSGSGFAPAEMPPGDAETQPTACWLCPTCDEPFSDFLRRCEWCGHDFGAGCEVHAVVVDAGLNSRLVWLTMLVFGVLLALGAYFAVILSRT